MLSEVPTARVNECFDSLEKNLVLILVKQAQNFAWVCVIMLIIVHACLIMANKIFTFKTDNRNDTFPTQFCVRSISNGFSATKSREGFLNLNVYNFSVE